VSITKRNLLLGGRRTLRRYLICEISAYYAKFLAVGNELCRRRRLAPPEKRYFVGAVGVWEGFPGSAASLALVS